MYVLSTQTGDLYACSEACVWEVIQVVDQSFVAITTYWSDVDRDVFCSGCAAPLGARRAAARILHEAMTPRAWFFYHQVERKVPRC